MSAQGSDQITRQSASLLDRLTDEAPATQAEAVWGGKQSRQEWERSLLRDVEALLNTKRAFAEVPEHYRQASTSLLQYGLPDFTGMGLHSPMDRAVLRSAIEAALRLFEPRLASVTVTLEEPKLNRPVLHFRVTAIMRLYPEPEPIRFDTLLHSDRREFVVVKEGN